jgi:hypothetical protein
MATVRGSALLWDQKELRDFVKQVSFGIATGDGTSIYWQRPEENQVSSTLVLSKSADRAVTVAI